MKIIYIILLFSTLARADNISFTGLIENSKYWKEEQSDFLNIDIDIVGCLQLGYGLDINNGQQQVNFFSELANIEYDGYSFSIGGNTIQKINLLNNEMFKIETAVGPQLSVKYIDCAWKNYYNVWSIFGKGSKQNTFTAEGNNQAFYLTPAVVVNIDFNIMQIGVRLYSDYGYNLLLSEKRTVKYNEAPDKIIENSFQAASSFRFGLGFLYNIPKWQKKADDFK